MLLLSLRFHPPSRHIPVVAAVTASPSPADASAAPTDALSSATMGKLLDPIVEEYIGKPVIQHVMPEWVDPNAISVFHAVLSFTGFFCLWLAACLEDAGNHHPLVSLLFRCVSFFVIASLSVSFSFSFAFCFLFRVGRAISESIEWFLSLPECYLEGRYDFAHSGLTTPLCDIFQAVCIVRHFGCHLSRL